MKFTKEVKYNKGKNFAGAIQEYDVEGSKVTVAFTDAGAFVFEDKDGLFDVADYRDMMKEAVRTGDASFPHSYNEFYAILDLDSGEISEKGKELGLEPVKDDILERLQYLQDTYMVERFEKVNL